MKTIFLSALLALAPVPACAGAFAELASSPDFAALDIPAPAAPEMQAEAAGEKSSLPACPPDMKGDRSVSCVITTKKTTVCSDGQKIDTSKVTSREVNSGIFGRELLGQYKDRDLRNWALHQARLGGSAHWGDGSHQNILATGKANPLTARYVVLPNRGWLNRKATVCVTATKRCVEAEALEVGPSTTFRDHSEVSVAVLMALGLNAHPNSGTYYGEMTFTFH